MNVSRAAKGILIAVGISVLWWIMLSVLASGIVP